MKPFLSENTAIIQICLCTVMKDAWVREEFCRDFGPLGNNFYFFLREVYIMWRKAMAISAFLGNDKERETVEFLADMVQHLNDLNAKLQGEKHSLPLLIWSLLLALSRYIQLTEKLITNIVEQLGDFLFENSCCSFLKTLLSDRHYRILNWSKKTHAHVCTFVTGPFWKIEEPWSKVIKIFDKLVN